MLFYLHDQWTHDYENYALLQKKKQWLFLILYIDFQQSESGVEQHKLIFQKATDLMKSIVQSPVPVIAKVTSCWCKGNRTIDSNLEKNMPYMIICVGYKIICRILAYFSQIFLKIFWYHQSSQFTLLIFSKISLKAGPVNK